MNKLSQLEILLRNEQEWHELMALEIDRVRRELMKIQEAKKFLGLPEITKVNLAELMPPIERKASAFQPRMAVQNEDYYRATEMLDKIMNELKSER